MDSRSRVLSKYTCTGANPQAAMEKLRGVLVSDAYGLVLGVRVARDAYNARPGPECLIFRLALWLCVFLKDLVLSHVF